MTNLFDNSGTSKSSAGPWWVSVSINSDLILLPEVTQAGAGLHLHLQDPPGHDGGGRPAPQLHLHLEISRTRPGHKCCSLPPAPPSDWGPVWSSWCSLCWRRWRAWTAWGPRPAGTWAGCGWWWPSWAAVVLLRLLISQSVSLSLSYTW